MRLIAAVFFLVTLWHIPSRGAGEGHPNWWWACQSAEFIIRGTLTYGAQPDITFTYKSGNETLTGYYIKARLKIATVLYVSPHGRHAETYKSYLASSNAEYFVYIHAQRLHSDPMIKNDLKVAPTDLIPSVTAIIILNAECVAPINGLVFQSAVPPRFDNEALALLRKRR
jgi:hypothetical protein